MVAQICSFLLFSYCIPKLHFHPHSDLTAFKEKLRVEKTCTERESCLLLSEDTNIVAHKLEFTLVAPKVL